MKWIGSSNYGQSTLVSLDSPGTPSLAGRCPIRDMKTPKWFYPGTTPTAPQGQRPVQKDMEHHPPLFLLETKNPFTTCLPSKTPLIIFFQERSLEFQREKEEKRQLEGRIAMLTGQMIGRGRRADGGAQGAVRKPPPNPIIK